MTAADWKIGDEFTTSGGPSRFRVTDVGSRVVVAVVLTSRAIKDPSWLHGPPYALTEIVFDEHSQRDMTRC
jgi:hypothetical protein